MDLIVIYSGEFGERVIGNLINYSTFCISCAEVCTHYKEDKYCLLELLPVSKDFRIEAIDMAVTIFYPDNALLPGSPGTCILYNVDNDLAQYPHRRGFAGIAPYSSLRA